MKFSYLFDRYGKRRKEIAQEIRNGEYTVWSFLFPKPARPFFIRLGVVILVAWLLFRFILHPAFINGESMLPRYAAKGFIFYWDLPYYFKEPQRGDIVVLRYAGDKILLLKRIIAFEGESVEFRNGVCYVNGEILDEPYVKFRSAKWNLPPRVVEKDNIYVMGDNRSMPLKEHSGGQIDRSRLKGKPLW